MCYILEQVAFLSHCSFINYAGAKITTAGEMAWKLLPANGHEFLTKFLGEGGGGVKDPLDELISHPGRTTKLEQLKLCRDILVWKLIYLMNNYYRHLQLISIPVLGSRFCWTFHGQVWRCDRLGEPDLSVNCIFGGLGTICRNAYSWRYWFVR